MLRLGTIEGSKLGDPLMVGRVLGCLDGTIVIDGLAEGLYEGWIEALGLCEGIYTLVGRLDEDGRVCGIVLQLAQIDY